MNWMNSSDWNANASFESSNGSVALDAHLRGYADGVSIESVPGPEGTELLVRLFVSKTLSWLPCAANPSCGERCWISRRKSGATHRMPRSSRAAFTTETEVVAIGLHVALYFLGRNCQIARHATIALSILQESYGRGVAAGLEQAKTNASAMEKLSGGTQ